MRRYLRCLVVVLGILLPGLAAGAETGSSASPKLWNGWGMTPAGQIVPLSNLQTVLANAAKTPAAPMSSDLPLQLVVSPDGKLLLAACGGFNNTGLAVLSMAEKRLTKFFPLPEVFNGLAFSKDGRRVFVSGGDSGVLHVFEYKDGQLSAGKPIRPVAMAEAHFWPASPSIRGPANSMSATRVTTRCGLSIPRRAGARRPIAVGLHPHSCALGADQRHLYVSNWGSRSVSVIDTQAGKRVREIGVGIRPNDMALSPDGRLFVACCRRQYGPRDPDTRVGKGGGGRQSRAAPAGKQTRDSLHFALPGLAGREHARRRGRRTRRQDALRGQCRQQRRDGGRYLRRQDLADYGLHSGGLVSDGAGRVAGQPHAAGRPTARACDRSPAIRRRRRPNGGGVSACRTFIPAISSRARSP